MNRMTATEFVSIVNHIKGDGYHAQRGVQGTLAQMFDVSRPTVSHAVVAFNKGEGDDKTFSPSISRKVREVYDAFLANGSVPEVHENIEDDGMRPFVAENFVRDRVSGRLYPAAKVEAGLIGNIGGKVETEEQIADRIAKRFSIMNRMVDGVINGFVPSMIVFGAPGIGKTWDIDKALKRAAATDGLEYDVVKGACTAPGLYNALYKMRDGGVVVLDDCDGIFRDEDALNLLKSALDSTDERTISWRKMSSWVYDPDITSDDEVKDDQVPNKFDFNGSVIFITNIDFQAKIAAESKMSPHFKALMSRSLYLDLTLKTIRDRLVRIRQVFLGPMHESEGLNPVQAAELMEFVESKATEWQELSLRMMKHATQIYKLGGDWKDILVTMKAKL